MSYTKNIVCLANSTKFSGSCFAGKEVVGNRFGAWIRPVSNRTGEEINSEEQALPDGNCPKLLDVVSVPLLEPKPTHHQQENHLIDAHQRWGKVGNINHAELPGLLDSVSGDLWINGSSSSAGDNDRVSMADAKELGGSLLLIHPESLTIIVQRKPFDGKKQVRADFTHNGRNYNLAVTDPVSERKYQDTSQEHELPYSQHIAGDGTYLCVSLAEKLLHDYYYKLIAAIIEAPA